MRGPYRAATFPPMMIHRASFCLAQTAALGPCAAIGLTPRAVRGTMNQIFVSPLDHAMSDEQHFEVVSGRAFREKYGPTAANRPTIHLDPSRVPEQFRQWIPLAEHWGIGDDLIRDDCVRKASTEQLRELSAFGDVYDAVLTEWLAGPEAHSPRPTAEYVAFTCLGMAWDLARVLAQKDEDRHGAA